MKKLKMAYIGSAHWLLTMAKTPKDQRSLGTATNEQNVMVEKCILSHSIYSIIIAQINKMFGYLLSFTAFLPVIERNTRYISHINPNP